jgi:broad specificity phosphatase PhoE
MSDINNNVQVELGAAKPDADMSPIVFDEKYDTRILLIRHGQSLGNAVRRFLGHTDLDLSELGYVQAQRTADLLADLTVSAVYSSPLIRAMNTAAPHAKMRGLDVIPASELKEMHAGEWENLYVSEIIERFGDMYHGPWTKEFGVFTIPGGEPCNEVANRFYNKILDIARAHQGQTVIVAAHAAAIRCFWGKLAGLDPKDLAAAYPFPQNASVSVVYFDGESISAGEYSHDKHLLDIV